MGNCCSQSYYEKHKPQRYELHIKEFKRTYKSQDFPENLAITHDPGFFRMKNKLDGQSVLLKRLDFTVENDLSHFVRRLDKIVKIEHDNLLKIYNYALEKNQFKDLTLCFTLNIAFESFDHTLQDELKFRDKASQSFSEQEIRTFMGKLVDLLEFLQLKNINPEPLHPSRIYIDSNKNPKLLYFGHSTTSSVKDIDPQTLSSLGDLSFHHVNQSNSFKANVFSLGLTLLEMMSVKNVNLDDHHKTIRHQYKAIEASEAYGPSIMRLVKSMVREDEHVRPDFLELKKMILMEEYLDSMMPKRPKKDRRTSLPNKVEPPANDYKINSPPRSHAESCDVTGIHLLEGMGGEYAGKEAAKGGLDTPMLRLEDSRHDLSPTKAYTDAAAEGKDDSSKRHEVYEEFLEVLKEEEEVNTTYGEIEILSENELFDAYNKKIMNLRRLTITLVWIKFNNEILNRLGEVIGRQSILDELMLELPRAEISTEGMITICRGIEYLHNLSVCYLDFRKLKIADKGLQALGKCLLSKASLVDLTLNLSDTMISEQNCQEISQWLRKLENLKSLDLNLGGNEIGDKGVALIGKGLGYMKNLENLMIFLYENELKGKEGVDAIFKGLKKLPKLKKINVNLVSNSLGDSEMSIIYNFVKESKVEEVVINAKDNNVSEEFIKKMEDEYAQSENVRLRF